MFSTRESHLLLLDGIGNVMQPLRILHNPVLGSIHLSLSGINGVLRIGLLGIVTLNFVKLLYTPLSALCETERQRQLRTRSNLISMECWAMVCAVSMVFGSAYVKAGMC